MADVLISDLDPAGALSGADLVELEQGTPPASTSGKVTLEQLRAFALTEPVNEQTGTSYTLQLSDAFKMVAMNNGSANAVTVPTNADVPFPVGTRIDLSQDGTGQTSVVADTGVTIRTPETLKIRKRYGKATIIKRGANTWDLEGNLEAAP